MDKLQTILQHYSILPQGVVHVTNRLYQIKADGKQYALKRSDLDDVQLKSWLKAYHLAEEKNLHTVIPLYLTNQRELFVKVEGDIYYLTPWVEGKINAYNKMNLENLFSSIGEIHLRTKRFHPLDKDHLEKNFLPYQKKCSKDEQQLLHTVERLEKKHYPSPLELQILTHYRDISYALRTSKILVDEMIRQAEKESGWGTSLLHGNLEKSHCFEHYFINWEKASIDHPIHDLVYFFHNETANTYQHTELLLQTFPAYLEENPLNSLEFLLLRLYLLNSSNYLHYIEYDQLNLRRNISMIEQTIHVEKMYKRIEFGLKFNAEMDTFTHADSSD